MTLPARVLAFVSAAAFLFPCAAGYAEDPPPGADNLQVNTNVRVEAIMVALPEDKFLSILPDLQKDSEIDGAVEKLLDGVKKKEVILRGYPMVVTQAGQRTVSESVREINIIGEVVPTPAPTADSAPATSVSTDNKTQSTPAPTAATADNTLAPKPYKAMISHSTGVTMEAEPTIQNDGQGMQLLIDIKDVELVDTPADKNSKPAKAGAGDAKNPMFDIVNVTAGFYIRSGQYKLLTTQKISKPEGYVEVVIIRTTILPSKIAGKPSE